MPEEPPKVYRKPFAVATSRNKVKALSSLSQFAIKAASTDSRVLSETEDPFLNVYGELGLIEPKYDPKALKELLYMNTYHARACKTKARDVAGSSWDIVDRNPDARKTPDLPEEPEDELEPGDLAPGEQQAPVTEDDVFGAGAPSTNGSGPVPIGTADPEHPALNPAATPGPTAQVPEVPDPESPKSRNRAVGAATAASPFAAEHEELKDKIEEFDSPLIETMYKVWLDVESIGYGAWEVVREGNMPGAEITDLVHIPAETLRRHRSKEKYQQRVGNETVWYKDISYEGEFNYEDGTPLEELSLFDGGDEDGDDMGFSMGYRRAQSVDREDDKRATEVVWIEQPDGVPDIIPAIPALYGDQSRTDYNISFFENYGVPSMMLLITGDYDPGPEDEQGVSQMEKFLETRLAEIVEEPFSTLVVSIPTQTSIGEDRRPSVTIEAVPLETNVSDASFRLYRQDNRDEILTANQVDPYRAQVIVEGQLGGSSAAESTEIYKQSTLRPKQGILEHRLNKWVIWDQDRYPNSKLEFAKIDTRDSQREIQVAAALFENAAITPNELIENFKDLFNLGGTVDHPAMDLHYLGGKPIDSDDPVTPEMDEMLGQVRGALGAVANNGLGAADADPITGEPVPGSAGMRRRVSPGLPSGPQENGPADPRDPGF